MQINNHILTLILLTSAISFILAGIVALLTYSFNIKKAGVANQLQLNLVNNETIILKTQFEIQEQVIQQISREIHDNISLSLALAKLNLQRANNQQNLTEPIALISESIVKLKNLSRTYSSEIISANGLTKAIESECDRFSKSSGINVEIIQSGEPIFLDNEREIVIFRITQECLNNILRHSKATHVIIELVYSQEYLTLTIVDNGIGIDLDNAYSSPGLGLRNMNSRAKQLNGRIKINPQDPQGTKVELIIPNYESRQC